MTLNIWLIRDFRAEEKEQFKQKVFNGTTVDQSENPSQGKCLQKVDAFQAGYNIGHSFFCGPDVGFYPVKVFYPRIRHLRFFSSEEFLKKCAL